MKALSVGLIKGNIDEVDQKVHMTWVQPRVLDLQQVSPHFASHISTEENISVPFTLYLMFGTLPADFTLTCCFLCQIKGMKERLDFWCGDVKNMAMLVEQQAHDILT